MSKPFILDRRQALGVGCGAASALAIGPRAFGAGRRVEIVMTAGLTGLAVHEVARAQGYFDQFGIDPNVQQVSDGGKCVAALVSGSSQICMWSGFNQVLPAIERGASVKIVAGALNLPSLAVFSGQPNIKRVADLRGKTIGIGAPGTVLHQMMGYLLQKHGIGLDQVSWRNVGSNEDILKAVSAKTVDAGAGDSAIMDQQAKFGVHALADGLLWKEIPDYTNQATYASNKAIAENRDLLVRTLAAYGKAYRYISKPASRDAYVKAWSKVSGASDTQQAVTQWTWIQQFQPYELSLALSDARINLVQKLNVQFNVQKQVMPVRAMADMSLARDAAKLLQ